MSARLSEVRSSVVSYGLPAPRLIRREPLPLLRTETPPAPLDAAFDDVAKWVARGSAATLGCVLPPEMPAGQVLDAAARALPQLASLGGRAMLALDVSALRGHDAGLLRLATEADLAGVLLVFDLLTSQGAPHCVDAMHSGVCALDASGLPLPVLTLAGRWRRSRADADWACARGLAVRVVKGHRADPLQPQHDAVAGFRALVARLAGRARFVTLATNDPALARDALTQLRRAGTPCELELMQGLPGAAAEQVARQLGVPVRVFVPWGAPRRQCTVSACTRDPRETRWTDTPSGFGALD